MKGLKTNPEDTVIFEDSESGIISAQASKATCIGFHTPGLTDSPIDRADYIIEDYQTIIDCLDI